MARVRWIGHMHGHARPALIAVGGAAVAIGADGAVPADLHGDELGRFLGTGDYEIDDRSRPKRVVDRILPSLDDAISTVIAAARIDAKLRKRLADFLAPFFAPPAPEPMPISEPEPEPEPDLVLVPGHEVSDSEKADRQLLVAQAHAKMQATKAAILADLKAADPPLYHDGRWAKSKLVAALYGLPDEWEEL